MRRSYINASLWIAIVFLGQLYAQDFENLYSLFPLRCQRELNNADYMLLFGNAIAKTNNQGMPIWSKEFIEAGSPLNANINLRCTQLTADGGFIITGTYSAAGTNDLV